MKRTYKKGKTPRSLKKTTIDQVNQLREQMEAEHADVFAKLQSQAHIMNAAQGFDDGAVGHSQDAELVVDKRKNMNTVLKFLEARGADGKTDKLTSQIFEMLRNVKR